jgi:hypothetical protein
MKPDTLCTGPGAISSRTIAALNLSTLQNWTIEQWFSQDIEDFSIMVEFGLNHSGPAPPLCPNPNISKSDIFTIAHQQIYQRALLPPHSCVTQLSSDGLSPGNVLQLVARWQVGDPTTDGVYWNVNSAFLNFEYLFGAVDTNASYINSMNLMLYPQGPVGGIVVFRPSRCKLETTS